MYRFLLTVFFALGVVLLAQPAQSQQTVPEQRFFAKVRIGHNAYYGDRGIKRGSRLDEYWQNQGFGVGLEAGYRFTSRFNVSVFLLSGHFSTILNNNTPDPELPVIDPSTSSEWLHSLGVLGRFVPFPQWRFRPYIHLGLTRSLVWINDALHGGWGPRIGLGAEYPISNTLAVFGEYDGVYVSPDQAIDRASTTFSESNSDPLVYLGIGLRYRFGKAKKTVKRPVYILNLDTPDSLTTSALGLFAAHVNLDEADKPLTYQWDFGDGTTADTPAATHQYALPGTYVVRFTASNSVSEVEREMRVAVQAPLEPIEIVAVLRSLASPHAGEYVTFEAMLRGSAPLSCTWDFGDNNTATSCEPTHRYETAGTYTVVLRVANPSFSAERTLSLTVQPNHCAELPTLNTVFFDRNAGTLNRDMLSFLQLNFAALGACANVHLMITGFATRDERNPKELALSRARAVAQYYINLGLPAAQAQVSEEVQIIDTRQLDEEEARWQYRRVTTTPARE